MDNDLFVLSMVACVAIFVSACTYVLTVEHADVEANRYHEVETVCKRISSDVESFDRRGVKCTNGAMFDLKEDK